MKSQLWTINPGAEGMCHVIDENGELLCECLTHEAATKLVANRAAALAGAAWIFGNTFEGRKHPLLVDIQPVIETALGPQGHKEKVKK